MEESVDYKEILDKWTERDLTKNINNLSKAFYLEKEIDQVKKIINSGKFPIITGKSGIGKTSLIHQLIKESVIESSPLYKKKIIQISIETFSCSLEDPKEIKPEGKKLIDALIHYKNDVVPFFKDLDLVFGYGLEHLFQYLAYHIPILLAEGEEHNISRMLGVMSGMRKYYVPVQLKEPSLEKTLKILKKWTSTTNQKFSNDALQESIFLSHRFLGNDNFPQKALNVLSQAKSINNINIIKKAHIIKRFSSDYSIPLFLIDPKCFINLEEIKNNFNNTVIGQKEAVSSVVQIIGLIKSGLASNKNSFGTFLFVGPTGVGKTYLAKYLSKFLFKEDNKVVRLNMANYQEDDAPNLLFGNSGYTNISLKRGLLTKMVDGKNLVVILLDEFEKAHKSVHDGFLQLFDEGEFINGNNETIACKSFIFIATSNQGVEVYRKPVTTGFNARPQNSEDIHKIVRKSVYDKFRFEFLNRFDTIIYFNPLNKEDMKIVTKREIEKLQKESGLIQRKIKLDVSDAAIDWIVANSDSQHGARSLKRLIKDNVIASLSNTLVSQRIKLNSTIKVNVDKNKKFYNEIIE